MRKFSFLFALILISYTAYAANITMSYSECQIDSSSNNTYCAPPRNELNTTQIYQQCIADSNARLDSINRTFHSLTTSVLESNSAFSLNFSSEIRKVQGVTLAEEYANCIVSLNTSRQEEKKWREETAQRESDISQIQLLSNDKVEKSAYDNATSQMNLLQEQVAREKEDGRNWAIIALAIGGIIGYKKPWNRQPPESRSGREGRPRREGNV